MKRGISPLISWVIIIGSVVAMAAFMSTYLINISQSYSEKQLSQAEQVYCEDISLSVRFINITHVELANNGLFTIRELRVLSEGNPPLAYEIELKPQNNLEYAGISPAEIIPAIKIGEKLIFCADRSVSVNSP